MSGNSLYLQNLIGAFKRGTQRLSACFLSLCLALASGAAFATGDLPGGPAVRQLNLQPPVTKIAADQHWLHWFMLVICTVIFLGVFAVMFWSVFKHRKSKGAVAAKFHESTTVEIIWTIVPFIIVILMALPATKTVVAMKDTSMLISPLKLQATNGNGATNI